MDPKTQIKYRSNNNNLEDSEEASRQRAATQIKIKQS